MTMREIPSQNLSEEIGLKTLLQKGLKPLSEGFKTLLRTSQNPKTLLRSSEWVPLFFRYRLKRLR